MKLDGNKVVTEADAMVTTISSFSYCVHLSTLTTGESTRVEYTLYAIKFKNRN